MENYLKNHKENVKLVNGKLDITELSELLSIATNIDYAKLCSKHLSDYAKLEQELWQQLEGKKVRIYIDTTVDFMNYKGVIEGRIEKLSNGKYGFFKKGSKKRYHNLTIGIYDGFYATLTVCKLEVIDKYNKVA